MTPGPRGGTCFGPPHLFKSLSVGGASRQPPPPASVTAASWVNAQVPFSWERQRHRAEVACVPGRGQVRWWTRDWGGKPGALGCPGAWGSPVQWTRHLHVHITHTQMYTRRECRHHTRSYTAHVLTCIHTFTSSRTHTPSSHNTQQHTFTRYVCKYAPCPFSHAHAFAQQYTRSCACKYTPHSRVPVCARTHTMHVSHLFEPSFLHSFFHPVSLRPGAWLTRGPGTWPVLSDLVRGMNGRGGGRSALRRAPWETAQLARRSDSGPRGRTASWAGPRGRQTDRPWTGKR